MERNSPDLAGSDETDSSGERLPGRRGWRLSNQAGSRIIASTEFAEIGGRCKHERGAVRDELKFRAEVGKDRFFLRLPSFGDGLAKTARILAIKGAVQRFDQRAGAQIAREHCGPGDRLEKGPVQPDREDQGHRHGQFGQTLEHDLNNTPGMGGVKDGPQFRKIESRVASSQLQSQGSSLQEGPGSKGRDARSNPGQIARGPHGY